MATLMGGQVDVVDGQAQGGSVKVRAADVSGWLCHFAIG
jgi:hypothetical protein